MVVTLDNGLRLVCLQRHGSAVEYFGISVNAGSRDEPIDGLAHFVEHTIFKGTRRRSASYIYNRMEEVGGELNAFTSKEETVVYTVAPAGNLRRSATLVAELVMESTFPRREIDRERDVVLDEVASYQDSPPDAVTDDFEDIIFAHSGLGHNILGNETSVRAITAADCMAWLKQFYIPTNIVAFYSGPADPRKVVVEVSKTLGEMHHGGQPLHRQVPRQAPHFDIERRIDLHQAHTMMGARIDGALSPRRHEWLMLANLLGGPGMNSLLNVELREKRGLVYSVDATASLQSDCGLLQIYFGCDADDIDECIDRVGQTLAALADGRLTPSRMAKVRRQYLGQLTVASENVESRVLGVGRAMHLYGDVPSLESTIKAVEAVTAQGIQECARQLIDTRLSRLTLK